MTHECKFCCRNIDDVINLGEIKRLNNVTVHYYCLLLATTVEQNGQDHEGILGFLVDDIWKELKRSRERVCCYCRGIGASVFCSVKNCKAIFHLPCGINNGSGHQFHGAFLSTCHLHRQRQKYNVPSTKRACPICYETLDFRRWKDIIWAPCCKTNSYFHRACVQKMALNAGYFFKCPICNDKNKFQKTMKNFGVFIPDRDASWETEPNAFQELYYRHDQCNSEKCSCVKGAQHSGHGQWEIVLCFSCGSQGRHVACLPDRNRKWACSDCAINKENENKSGLQQANGVLNGLNDPSCSNSSDSGTPDTKRIKLDLSEINAKQPDEDEDVIILSDSDDEDVVIVDVPVKKIMTTQGTVIPVHMIKEDYLKYKQRLDVLGDITCQKANVPHSPHANGTNAIRKSVHNGPSTAPTPPTAPTHLVNMAPIIKSNEFDFGFKIVDVRSLAIDNQSKDQSNGSQIVETNNCLVVRNGTNETTIKCKSNKTSVKEAFYSAIRPTLPSLPSLHLPAPTVGGVKSDAQFATIASDDAASFRIKQDTAANESDENEVTVID